MQPYIPMKKVLCLFLLCAALLPRASAQSPELQAGRNWVGLSLTQYTDAQVPKLSLQFTRNWAEKNYFSVDVSGGAGFGGETHIIRADMSLRYSRILLPSEKSWMPSLGLGLRWTNEYARLKEGSGANERTGYVQSTIGPELNAIWQLSPKLQLELFGGVGFGLKGYTNPDYAPSGGNVRPFGDEGMVARPYMGLSIRF